MSLNLKVPQEKRNQLRVWLTGCAHPKSDTDNGRSSITEAITHMEVSEGLLPDFALMLGDYSTSQTPAKTPDVGQDAEGSAVVSQMTSGIRIKRKHIYTIKGNHDAGKLEYQWYNKYIDTFGENTATSTVGINNYPYPIIRDGVLRDHYAINVGNVLFLMLNDRNDVDAPVGRNTPSSTGGYPSGALTRRTWTWVKEMITANPNKIIMCFHHNLLKETTIATGDNEGVNGGYHGSSGKPIASGRLEDIWKLSDSTTVSADEIITYMDANNGAIFSWFGAHTHHNVDETYSGRGSYILKHGTHFLSIGSLSKFHLATKDAVSRFMVFENGSTDLEIMQYVHISDTKDNGFYRTNDLTLTLPLAFKK